MFYSCARFIKKHVYEFIQKKNIFKRLGSWEWCTPLNLFLQTNVYNLDSTVLIPLLQHIPVHFEFTSHTISHQIPTHDNTHILLSTQAYANTLKNTKSNRVEYLLWSVQRDWRWDIGREGSMAWRRHQRGGVHELMYRLILVYYV